MSENIRVAIDGPSGAGKSTLARSVAARLNFLYVDTGAIYRTIGYAVWRKGIDPRDRSAVVAVLPDLEICLTYGTDGLQHMELNGMDVTAEIRLPEVSRYASLVSAYPEVRAYLLEMQRQLAREICLTYGTDGLQHMELNGMDVTAEIRLPEVSRYASLVSAYPEVRAYLLEMQRQLARENSVVMDGRDIGTVVLPDAEVKVFLTASAEERARRRMLELEERGTPEPYAAILRAIQERDWNDTHRDAAPLRQAEDAVLLDTTALDFVQSEDALLHIIRERTGL